MFIVSILLFCLFFKCGIRRKYFNIKGNIPTHLYQTYKTKSVPPIVKKRWMDLNPEYTYHLYDDDDCYNFLLKYYGFSHANFFKHKLIHGPIKSDFWRVCMLYIFGGVYADIDIVPLLPIRKFLHPNTTFYTCIDYTKKNYNPMFIASTPKNEILKECIDIYMKDKKNQQYDYFKFSITSIVRDVLKPKLKSTFDKQGIHKINNNIIQLSEEICPSKNHSSFFDCYVTQDNMKIMNSRDSNIYDSAERIFK
jgi:mannosyltransferase OCH1-like enzyme